MKNSISIKNLIKSYKEKDVLKNVNILIDKPGIYLLAGANGSGKTTLLEIIAGLREADAGEILIDNYKPNTINAKKYLGFLCQQNNLRKNVKVSEEFTLVKQLYNINIDSYEYLKKYKLEQYYNQKCKNLSGGTKRRVLIAMLLIAKQNIIILDEPASGLDPYSRDEIWTTIKDYSKQNIVIVSDHYLNQAAMYSNYIYLLNKGEIILQDTFENIKKTWIGKKIAKIKKEKFEQIKDSIELYEDNYKLRISGTVYNIFIYNNISEITKILSKNDIYVNDIEIEDIFFYYISKYDTSGV